MKIGNILLQDVNLIEGDGIYNVISTMDDIISDLPTLIIGYELCKNNFTDINFLDRKLSENFYWTFTSSEYYKYHHEDLYDFKKYCLDNYFKQYKFINVDLIQLQKNSMKKIIKKLIGGDNLSYHYKQKNVIYIINESYIFGIDLNQCEYLMLDSKKIYDKIKSISNIFIDDEKYLTTYESYLEQLNYEVKYIPLLYSIFSF